MIMCFVVMGISERRAEEEEDDDREDEEKRRGKRKKENRNKCVIVKNWRQSDRQREKKRKNC